MRMGKLASYLFIELSLVLTVCPFVIFDIRFQVFCPKIYFVATSFDFLFVSMQHFYVSIFLSNLVNSVFRDTIDFRNLNL